MSTSLPTPEKGAAVSSQESRKKRIEDLLLIIGGFEESIRLAQNAADWNTAKELKELKTKYYERLKKVIYGLRET